MCQWKPYTERHGYGKQYRFESNAPGHHLRVEEGVVTGKITPRLMSRCERFDCFIWPFMKQGCNIIDKKVLEIGLWMGLLESE